MGLEAPVALTPLARGRGAPTGQAWGGVSLTKRVRLGAGYGWLHLKGRKRPSQTPGLGAGGGPHLECPQETRGTVCGDTCDDHDCGGATGFYWVEAAKHPATQIQPPHATEWAPVSPGDRGTGPSCAASALPRAQKVGARVPGLALPSVARSVEPFEGSVGRPTVSRRARAHGASLPVEGTGRRQIRRCLRN